MKRFVVIPAVILAVVAVSIYLYTAAKFMLWLDGARFVACIVRLEICNPPQPTHVLLAYIFTKIIPFGSYIFRIQLLSSLTAGTTLVLLYVIVLKLLEMIGGQSVISRKRSDREISLEGLGKGISPRQLAGRNDNMRISSAFFAFLVLAFNYEFWAQAHNVETFQLILLMEVVILYLLTISLSSKNFFKRFLVISFLSGLATGTNPIIASVAPSIIIVLVRNRTLLTVKRVGLIGVIGVIMAYVYLPFRAQQNPFINWGRPVNFSGLWEVSTGQGLNVYLPEIGRVNGFTGSPVVFLQSSWRYFEMLWLRFTPLLLPFVALGGWYLFIKNRKLFYVFVAVPMTNFLFSALYYSGNQESWLLMSDLVFAIFAGVGFYFVTSDLPIKSLKILKLLKKYGLVLIGLPLVLLFIWWPVLNRQGWVLTQDYIDNLYRPIKTPAILIGSSDLYDAVSLYVHEMEKGEKAKVIPITDNMFFVLKWYRDNLRLTAPINIPNDSYIGHNDADEYSRYINDLIKANYKRFNIYITQPSLRNNFLPRADFGPSLIVDPKFQLVPQGMIFEVIAKEATSEPRLNNFDYSFKSPGFPKKKPTFLERVYKSEFTGMFNEYALSFENLADYYARGGKKDLALKYYQKAYDSNPKNSEIVSRLGNYYGSLNDHYRAMYYFKKALDLDPKDISLMFNLATAAENIGDVQQAGQLYQKILQLAKANSSIAPVALQKLQALTNPQPTIPPDVKSFKDASMNLDFSYLPDYSLKYVGQKLLQVSASKPDKDKSVITIYSKVLLGSETPDKFVLSLPFKISGKFVSSQPSRLGDFEIVVNVYQDGGVQTHLLLLKKGKQGFAVKIEQANKPSAGANVILQTMKTIK